MRGEKQNVSDGSAQRAVAEKSEYADGIGLASIVFGYPRHIAAKPNTDFKGFRP